LATQPKHLNDAINIAIQEEIRINTEINLSKYNNSKNYNKKFGLFCEICEINNHTSSDCCFKKNMITFSNNSNNYNFKNKQSDKFCTYYKKNSHTKDECYTLKNKKTKRRL